MSDAGGDVLAVVIGRAGSKGLPGKNALLLAGRPMICHSIQHALDASAVDRVVVSTDGDEIAAAARAMNVPVIVRPAELADDHAPVDAAVRHAVGQVEGTAAQRHEVTKGGSGDAASVPSCLRAFVPFPKTIVILYANVPVRPPNLIDRAVEMLRQTGADSVQSYCDVGKHHPYWMVTLDEQQRVHAHNPNAVHRRQDLPKLLLPDGGVIAVTHDSLFCEAAIRGVAGEHPHAFLGSDRRGIEVPPGAVVDVDTAIDLAVAEAMLRRRSQSGRE